MNQPFDKINCFALKGRLLFFAFGLDMDELTLKVHYPNATKRTVACLPGHRLVFRNESSRWRSGIATIDRKRHEYVWGIVWELDTSTLNSSNVLDVPGVLAYVEVLTIDGYSVICGTRQVVYCPGRFRQDGESLPSYNYVSHLVNAALQAQLPPPYIFALSTKETNDEPTNDSESDSGTDSESDEEAQGDDESTSEVEAEEV